MAVTPIITGMAMDDASAKPLLHDSASAILPLFAWLSPSYPVGCYAYSHTLEWAVEAGDVTDEATLVAWLVDLLTLGFGRNDAILLSHAYRAVRAGDRAALEEVNELALGLVAVLGTLSGNEPAGAQLPRRNACRLAVAAPDSP